MDSPATVMIMVLICAVLLHGWIQDYRSEKQGQPNPKAWPGTTSCSTSWILTGIIGSLLIVGLATFGEIVTGTSDEQSTLPLFAIGSLLSAGFIEELTFRGFFVIQKKGTRIRTLSCIGFSLIFTLFHYQYYTETIDETLVFKFNFQVIWTLCILFVQSLWFYYLRFSQRNPHMSLLPCFFAHASANLAVFLIKALQGFVEL
jgi:membrane protease YdiL (CAAX protease family)